MTAVIGDVHMINAGKTRFGPGFFPDLDFNQKSNTILTIVSKI